MLTGCLSAKPAEVVRLEPLPTYVPARPAPVTVRDVQYRFCTEAKDFVCLSRSDAKAEVANKVQIGKFLKEQNAIIDYYEETAKKQNLPEPSPDK